MSERSVDSVIRIAMGLLAILLAHLEMWGAFGVVLVYLHVFLMQDSR